MACTRLSDLKTGEEIWCRATDCGFEFHALVGSSVLNLYAECQKMDEAIEEFDRTLRRDIVCWTTIIIGFAKSGLPIEAFDMYKRIRNKVMEGDGVVMVGWTQACANLGDLKLGLFVHGHLIQKDHLMDVVIQTSLRIRMPRMDI